MNNLLYSNSNNNFNRNSIGMLDILSIIGFIAQIDNMSRDEIQAKYNKELIKTIANEIEKLHKENDIIIRQNNEILNILKERDCD